MDNARKQSAVVAIYVAPAATAPMLPVDQVRAVAGRGLEGDRYFARVGTFSDKLGPDREVTLIEREAVEAFTRESGLAFSVADSRRNVVTSGMALNGLVGREFRVGEVILRGVRLCPPCAHLGELTVKEVVRGLAETGGLRAQVVSGGVIRVGDPVEVSA